MTNNDAKSFHIKFIMILGIICYARLYLINTTFWDDNCWLLSLYNSNSLDDFLNTGFRELRRVPIGIFLYYLISLHKETEIYFPVLNTITILIQIATPLFIYLFVRKAFKSSFLAFCVALIALLYPIDTTTPIFSTLSYRLGLLLSVISLYTSVAAIRETVRWRLIVVSMLCAAVAQYVFIEGAIALEPARLLIIWHLLSGQEDRRRIFFKLAGMFLVITLPLIYYKLMFKPYGVYAGTYQSDPFFFLNWRMHRRALVAFFFLNWAFFAKYVFHHLFSAWSVALGLVGALGGYLQFGRISSTLHERFSAPLLSNSFARSCRENRFVFLAGLSFYLPPVLMYEFAGRVVFTGVESRHGSLLVIGFALMWGGLFYAIFPVLQSSRFRLKVAYALMTIFIGAGVFFHNVNHDLFLASQRDQQQFWRAFTTRFPTLPERASFVFDVSIPDYLYDAPFGISYGIEPYINLLYARSTEVDGFRNYLAGPVSRLEKAGDLSSFFSLRHPGTGRPFIHNEPLIIIKYENGGLLVNREILEKYPDSPYRNLADRDFPELPPKPESYPLRHKLPNYY